jgi:hypothetical protein
MIASHIFPDDKLRIILHSAYADISKPEIDTEQLHILIYESKLVYPELFSEFSFRTTGTFPYSELLERIMMRARISGVLRASNRLKSETDKYVRGTLYPRFAPEDLSVLQLIGQELNTRYIVKKVSDAVKDHPGNTSIEIYQEYCDDIPYPKFSECIDVLKETNRIAEDSAGNLCWIYNPALFEKYSSLKDLIVR